jgi:phenylalanyl-tRNA synthetase beta chain
VRLGKGLLADEEFPVRISWNWLSEMVDLSQVGGPQGLADLLTSRGLEVEAIERQDQGLEKVVTAHVVERVQHPQSDRLSLCKVSIGSGEPLQIVCGASNARAGIKVALAQVGADLPNGMKIGVGKIRGVESYGMLCSLEELKLADKSEGIMELPTDTKLGLPLAQVLGRDDTLLTLKLTANRGDCMSHFGLAREVAAAIGKKPCRPGEGKVLDFGGKLPISIHLDAGESAPQFFGVMIEGVKIGPSPEWLVKRLEALGSRSISNVVDATNLVMLELGHPMHAYDADLLQGGRIGVRQARAGEKLPLLDGQTVELAGTELVIADGADGARPVGLAGVMGGGNSEVRDGTKRLFLECAEFASSQVRKASTKHQRRTDAAQRFEKGIDPTGLGHAISRLAHLIVELGGGKITAAGAVQLPSRNPFKRGEVLLKQDFVPKFLGIDAAQLGATQVSQVLKALDCELREQGASSWSVTVPAYRRDLRIPEDLAEEVARTIGYDKIPATIPVLTSDPRFGASHRDRLALIARTKDALVASGLHETINFAFGQQAWLEKFGLPSRLKLLNPLSEEHEVMVPSLLPGLVRNALDNWHKHFGAAEELPIRLFELRPVFSTAVASGGQALHPALQAKGEMETGATERLQLAIAISGPRYSQALKADQAPVDFYDLKAIIDGLLEQLGARGVRTQPMSASRTGGNPLFHPGQSVEILAGKDVAGHFGLLHPGKARDLKVRAPLWLAQIDWEAIAKLSRQAHESKTFKSWPQFPAIERDFALVVKSDITSDKITQLALKVGKPLAKVAKVFDIYRGSQVAEGMTSVAVRVIFYEESRSLQEAEAENASTQILEAWKRELGAELRG